MDLTGALGASSEDNFFGGRRYFSNTRIEVRYNVSKDYDFLARYDCGQTQPGLQKILRLDDRLHDDTRTIDESLRRRAVPGPPARPHVPMANRPTWAVMKCSRLYLSQQSSRRDGRTWIPYATGVQPGPGCRLDSTTARRRAILPWSQDILLPSIQQTLGAQLGQLAATGRLPAVMR